MNEMQKQALPGYKDLAEQVKHQSEVLTALSEKAEQSNELLALIAQCHIDTNNPDVKGGYLEQILAAELEILRVAICCKHKDEKHRNWGTKLALVGIGFAAIAFVVEVATGGKVGAFTGMIPFIKGLFAL